MHLWRCRLCHTKIESVSEPEECPKCGKEYIGYRNKCAPSKKGKRKEGYFVLRRKEYRTKVSFHLIGKLK